MADAANRGLRRGLAAVLILALTLAGLGRALATAAPSAPFAEAAVVGAPICHSGAGERPDGPARDASHGCCDDCALPFAAVLPAPPSAAAPAPVARLARRARAVPRAPAIPRPRDHRLARGPPAA